jgi:general secretion pathway protein F
MKYQVRHVNAGDASVTTSAVEAADEAAARAQVQQLGSVVLSVARDRSASAAPAAPRRDEYTLLCREVRTLIQAGMTVVEAVDTLAARASLQNRGPSLVQSLRDRLQQGQSLSVALGSLPGVPAVLVAAVKAGERTSNLQEALDDFLKFEGLTQQLRRKVTSAAIYPAVVTVLGVGISVFLMVVVLPNFARMYKNLKAQASGANALMMQLSSFLSEHRVASFVVLGLVLLGLAAWVRSGAAWRQAQVLGLRIRWIRLRVEDFQLAMMFQAMALLLRGGYPMTEAMTIAGQSALSPHLRSALSLAHQKVTAGEPVAASLHGAGLCDEVDRRLMAAAERNGDFHLAADVVSRMHGERFELFVERMTRIVEPLLLLGVALLVGTIVVMMYLPVFDMATRMR